MLKTGLSYDTKTKNLEYGRKKHLLALKDKISCMNIQGRYMSRPELVKAESSVRYSY